MQQGYLNLLTQYARRALIDALLQRPSIDSHDLAKITGLPLQVIASLALDLERAGWLKWASPVDAKSNGATRVYELANDAAYSFGVDLGGTKIAAAIADLTGRIIGELTEATDPRGEHHVVNQIVALAGRLGLSTGIGAGKIESVMVGIPGAIDPRTGHISLATNIKGLGNFDIFHELQSHFGPDVAFDNDVNLAMLGEVSQGCARGVRNAAFLAIGTGVGLGLLVDGHLFRGASGAAGEVAYLPIGQDLASTAALSTGAFELEVGSLAIMRRYRSQGRALIASVQDIFTLLHEKDDVAKAVLEATARSIALAVAALQSILDLEVIVLGGSIGVRPELVESVQRQMAAVFSRPVSIVASELGTRAGLVGATHGAVTQLHDRHFVNQAVSDGDVMDVAAHFLVGRSNSGDSQGNSDPADPRRRVENPSKGQHS